MAKTAAASATAAGMGPGRSKLDKFGLMLVLLNIAALLVAVFVWMEAAKKVDVSPTRDTEAVYDAVASDAKLVNYSVEGYLPLRVGEVDAIVINKGFRDGVRKGDVFRPSSSSGKGEFIEFAVMEVGDRWSKAVIILGTNTPYKTHEVSLNEAVLSSMYAGGSSTSLERTWQNQEVRRIVQRIGE